MSEIPKAASHPDVPRPSNAELIALALKVCHAIEACGASPELTNAVMLASDLHTYLKKPEVVEYMPLMHTGLGIRMSKLNAKQANINHGQTLVRLAERGGLCPREALAIVERRAWTAVPDVPTSIKLLSGI